MFRVEEAHEAIICEETFDAVQAEINRRADRFKKPVTGNVKHLFSGKLVCGICGGSFHRKEAHGGFVWTCGRFNTFGKSACASKHIPEGALMSVTATALGEAAFDERVFRDRTERVLVCNENTLIYRFKDGTETTVKWKYKSRSQSWTDEMKEAARQKTLERNKQKCQK